MNDEPKELRTELIRKGNLPRRRALYRAQTDLLVRLIRELEQALLALYGAREASALHFQWDTLPQPWAAPEYLRFLEGAMACGCVFGNLPMEDCVDLREVNGRPEATVGVWGVSDLRRYLHTLHRADKWADGYTSAVVEALASGALQLVAQRLEHDDSLHED